MDNENMCGSEEVVEMFCERCRKKDINRSADGFCEECVLYLCSVCLDEHSYFRSEHGHKDKVNMPKDVCLKVCPGHADEIIKFYCASCDKFFCSLCKTKEHKTCKDISHLPHLVVGLENNEEFKRFEKEVEQIVSEIGDLESEIERKNVLAESIFSGIKSQMETIRERLYQMADTRIESITKDVDVTKEKDKKALAADVVESSVMKSTINALNSEIQKLLRETKRCELFIIMKESCIKRKNLKSGLQKLKEHGITEFEFEEDENCIKLFEAASHFGKLVFKDSECSDEQNGGKTLTKEELKELVAIKEEENTRLSKDIKDFEAKYVALEKEQGKLKELVAAKDEENRKLAKGIKDFEAKYSALEKEQGKESNSYSFGPLTGLPRQPEMSNSYPFGPYTGPPRQPEMSNSYPFGPYTGQPRQPEMSNSYPFGPYTDPPRQPEMSNRYPFGPYKGPPLPPQGYARCRIERNVIITEQSLKEHLGATPLERAKERIKARAMAKETGKEEK